MFVNSTAYWVNETVPFKNETEMQNIPVFDQNANLMEVVVEEESTPKTQEECEALEKAANDAAAADAAATADGSRRQLHKNAEFFYHEKLTTPHNHTFYDEDCKKYEDI